MEDKKVLMAEDLGSVAGGVRLAQLTEEERNMYYALQKKFEQAVENNKKGLCDQAAVDAANREFVDFTVRMNEKYS